MDVKIMCPPAGGTVQAIPSKSAAHRIMIAASLSGLDLAGRFDGLSEDITATRECMQRLAAAARTRGEDSGIELPCGESGSTLRFLIPVAGALGISSDFICEGRLPDRPMQPFLEVLAEHGCRVEGRNPKKLRGRLSGGTFCLPGDISSQYVTGLLLALPLAAEDSRIIISGKLQSRPYIDLTLQVLSQAGISVREHESCFEVPGRQTYRLSEQELAEIEGDWSNAAFWLCMDAMLQGRPEGNGRRICCTGLSADSKQGDRKIAEILERGRQAKDAPMEVDVSDIPDLVPALAAYASSRPRGAVTHIVNAGRLRFKESDRLRTVSETLTALGADIEEEAEGLLIRGTETLHGGEVSSCGDHRIAMMAAEASCIADGEILIRGADAVSKSYPRFFEDLRSLGAEVRILQETE